MMINAYYHHLSYPSVSTFRNKLEEALKACSKSAGVVVLKGQIAHLAVDRR